MHQHKQEKQRQEREYKITQEQLKIGARISLKSLEGMVAECRSVGVLLCDILALGDGDILAQGLI
jgi:hypothetical protein